MLEHGQVVADYTVVKLLSENNSIQSYLVKSVDGEAKLLLAKSSAEWSRSRRRLFHDQIKALAGASLSAVCLPVASAEEQGFVTCVYPLPAGNPLSDQSAPPAPPLSPRAALELIRDIAGCLEQIHAAGQVHGGLSLQTVYTCQHSFSCLADCSLWTLVPLEYLTGFDSAFVSPEQVRGEDPAAASDIYSLGCLFHYLLTGRPPFAGEDSFAVGLMHLNGQFPELPEPLAIFSELLQQMTSQISAERLTAFNLNQAASLLLAQEAIDQISFVPFAEVPAAESVKEQEAPIISVAASEADDITARIEARLQQNKPINKAPPLPSHSEEESSPVPLQVTERKAASLKLPILLLIAGVVAGFGFGYFSGDLLKTMPTPEQPLSVYSLKPVPPDLAVLMSRWQESDFDAAKVELTRLLANFPESYQLHNNLAAFYAAEGQLDQARQSLEKAFASNEDFATLYRNLSSVYTEIARDSYGRALQMDSSPASLYLDLFTNEGVVSWSADTPVLASARILEEQSVDSQNVKELEIVVPAVEVPVVVAVADAEEITDKVTHPAVIATTEPPVSETEVFVIADTETSIVEPASEVVQMEDGQAFLQRWARAWSNQDIEGYLSFYGAEFMPSTGISRDLWVTQRRSRLTRPENIQVTLGEFKVRQQSADAVQMEVIQDYRSDRYSDRTRKLFELKLKDQEWKIVREVSLEVLQ